MLVFFLIGVFLIIVFLLIIILFHVSRNPRIEVSPKMDEYQFFKMFENIESLKKHADVHDPKVIEILDVLKRSADEHQMSLFPKAFEILDGLKRSTDNLSNILSNNQLRGRLGQEIAENLLKSIGFVKGQNYTTQEVQEETGNRPDLTVILPDKKKINIDVKFPFQALKKYNEAEDHNNKALYLKEFKENIKDKIKDIKKYINIKESVDFIVLFIPNEMIFSFIYDQCSDEYDNAMKNKINMCGPFSFTALFRMVYQAHENFKYQENVSDIVALIKLFRSESCKSSESLESLGKEIDQVRKKYDEVCVRDRQLKKVMEKIQQSHEIKDTQNIE